MTSTLTRRALLASLGTTAASATFAVPYVNAAHSEEECATHSPILPHEPNFTGASDDLSFVERRGDGIGFNYWTVETTGDYAGDCAFGRRLAAEYLGYVGKHPTNGNATLLQCIVNDMIARTRDTSNSWGRHTTGIEIGFLAGVNEYALATAAILAGHRLPA